MRRDEAVAQGRRAGGAIKGAEAATGSMALWAIKSICMTERMNGSDFIQLGTGGSGAKQLRLGRPFHLVLIFLNNKR